MSKTAENDVSAALAVPPIGSRPLTAPEFQGLVEMPAEMEWFRALLEAVMAWEFDRVITGHRDVPETNKAALGQALREAGFLSARNG